MVRLKKEWFKKTIKNAGLKFEEVDAVIIDGLSFMVVGSTDDESHNCDESGCGSLECVLYRGRIE